MQSRSTVSTIITSRVQNHGAQLDIDIILKMIFIVYERQKPLQLICQIQKKIS